MKQEIWRFESNGMLSKEPHNPFAEIPACIGDHHFTLFPGEIIGGVTLKVGSAYAENREEACRLCAREIRRQLSAHGVKVEIRRVKR